MGLDLLEGGEVGIRLDDGEPVRHCRPAVDVLFHDAARLFGAATLGVVLTGMGADGTEGARAIVKAGGSIVAQDALRSAA
jgi:two-component system chemotaxis response regulator CheB